MTRAIIYSVLVCALILTGLVAYDLHQRDSLLPKPENAQNNVNKGLKNSTKKTTNTEQDTATKVTNNATKTAKGNYTIKVNIKGIRTTKGQIIAQLYDNMHDFNNNRYDKALSNITLPAKGFTGTLLFENLTDKQYAIVMFHDENNNQRFDQIGTVLEGYGYSNNVGKTSLPNFHQAAFVANKDKSLTINVTYH